MRTPLFVVFCIATLTVATASASTVEDKHVDLWGNGKPLSVTKQDMEAFPGLNANQIKRKKAKLLFRDGAHVPSEEMIDMIVHIGTREEYKYAKRYVLLQNYKKNVQARIAILTTKARKSAGIIDNTTIKPTLSNVQPSSKWRLMWYFNPGCAECAHDHGLVKKVAKDKRVPFFAAVSSASSRENTAYIKRYRIPVKVYRDTWQSKKYRISGTPNWVFEDVQHHKIYKVFGANHDEIIEEYIAKLSGRES